MSAPAEVSVRRRVFGRLAKRLCFGVIVGLLTAPVFADAGLDDYNLAVQLYGQKRWALAADSFRKFLKDYPEHDKRPYARLYLGLTQVNQGDYSSARDSLRGFVKDYPKNQNVAQAKYRVGECSYLLNDLAAAGVELQTYVTDHPQDSFIERALPYLGDVQLRLNDAAAAEGSFQTAIDRFPKGPLVQDARFGLAKAQDAQKKLPEALKNYEELAKGDGSRAAEAQFQIGSHHFDAGEHAQAAAAYQKLWQRFPASPLVADARLNAGFAFYRNGQFSEAAQAFEALGEDSSRRVTAGYWRGLSLKSTGNPAAAAEALAKTAAQSEKHPLAEVIAFQQAVCERLAGHSAAAQQAFLAVVKTYPNGEYADDALHFATEMAIETGDFTTAAARLSQFTQAYPQSGLRLYQELLAGRLALGQAAQLLADQRPATEIASRYAAAAQHFERVLGSTMLARTKSQARYYLALTRQLEGKHEQALELLQPLIVELPAKGPHELADALVLQADSLGQANRWNDAVAALDRYLAQFPQARQRARALSLLAIGQTHQGDEAAATTALDRLAKEPGGSAMLASASLQLAELADQQKDWPAAAKWYERLTQLNKGSDSEAYAWRGLGWAQFQQRQFAEAAKSFARLEQSFPQHSLAPEAAYYRGESLREAGELDSAFKVYTAAFTQFAPKQPAAPDAEQQSPLVFVYRAGLQAARTARRLKDVNAADKAYAALLEAFPKPRSLDKLLDEWALLNYEAERFPQADAIFSRLIRDVPDSDLADNARLSLAESDLLSDRLAAAQQAFEELRRSPRSDEQVKERAHYQLIVLAMDAGQQRWSDVKSLATEFAASYPDSAQRPYVEYCRLEALLADPRATMDVLVAAEQQLVEQMKPTPPKEALSWFPRLWVLLAETRFRLKKYADVDQTVKELKQRLPNAEMAYQAEEVLGRSYKQQAQFDEARQAFQRVLDDPAAFRTETAAKSQFLIAETFFLQEKWPEAFLAYTKVYSSYAFPDWQAAALLQAGKCDEQQGQWKEAADNYAKLIDEFPQSTFAVEARQRQTAARKRAGQ